jgi:hypothetical protein
MPQLADAPTTIRSSNEPANGELGDLGTIATSREAAPQGSVPSSGRSSMVIAGRLYRSMVETGERMTDEYVSRPTTARRSLRMPSVVTLRHLLGHHSARQLPYRDVRHMREPSDFAIVETHGRSFPISKGHGLVPDVVGRKLQRLLAATKPLRYFAVGLILCRKAPATTPRL